MKYIILRIVESLLRKKIIVIPKETFQKNSFTASLSKYGFWYVGNVFNISDVAYGIARNGVVEKKETELVVYILSILLNENRAIIFYDIGANTGYYSILSAFYGKGKVTSHSFEPLLEHTHNIQISSQLNNLVENVNIHTIAIGDRDEELLFYKAGTGSSFDQTFLEDDTAPSEIISTKRLDNFISENKIPLPNFIKIDIEGYEYKALQGATQTLAHTPILFIEIAYSLKSIKRKFINKNFEATFDFLNKFGYESYSLGANGVELFNPYVQKPDGTNMYLFLHNLKHREIITRLLNEKIY